MKTNSIALRLLALTAATLFATMSIGATVAAASPGNPVGPTDYANPVQPPTPDPKPSTSWAPKDPELCAPGQDCDPADDGPQLCSPDQDCTPDDRTTPERTPGGDIPTPNRIDTGAGGTAGGYLFGVLAVTVATVTLIVASASLRRIAGRHR